KSYPHPHNLHSFPTRRSSDLGEKDAALYSALGHVQCEMHDYEAAAATYAQLAELEPGHRTAHFNRGVCLANLKQWQDAADSFRRDRKSTRLNSSHVEISYAVF